MLHAANSAPNDSIERMQKVDDPNESVSTMERRTRQATVNKYLNRRTADFGLTEAHTAIDTENIGDEEPPTRPDQ